MAFTKQPNDVLDYDVDMSDWFTDAPEDHIQSITATVTSATEAAPTLELGPLPHPVYELIGDKATRFKVWVGGGTNYGQYKVTLLVLTRYDRKKEVELQFKVRDK